MCTFSQGYNMGQDYYTSLSRTKAGTLYLTECGGGARNSGSARVITGPYGEKKQALVMYTSGHLSNNDHAVIPVEVGDHIVSVYGNYSNTKIIVRKITLISGVSETPVCSTTTIAEYVDGEWIVEPPHYMRDAIKACMEKYNTYHCRYATWCLEPVKDVI